MKLELKNGSGNVPTIVSFLIDGLLIGLMWMPWYSMTGERREAYFLKRICAASCVFSPSAIAYVRGQ